MPKPTDLERAVSELTAKLPQLTLYHDYYSGAHPLVYTNERLRDIFRPLDAKFTANYCSIVIDACADRITLESLVIQNDEKAQDVMDELWQQLQLAIESDDVHDAALWAGEAFLVIWPDTETDEIQVCYHDPRLCHVEYSPDNPKRKLWAAKWWENEAEQECYLNLYYPDRIEYYEASRKQPGTEFSAPQDNPVPAIKRGAPSYTSQSGTYRAPIEAKRFRLRESAANPFGVIPVFHFRNKGHASDLVNAIPLQNGVNKLMTDLMVGAEFGAFPQKWAISQVELGSQLDASGNPTGNVLRLKNAPNEVWNLPASDGQGQPTSVGQFQPTDLGNFLAAIDRIVSHLGAITGTPRHYFFQQGGDPSGEALMTMEAPLNKKAKDRIDRFTTTWREAGAFLLQLAGVTVDPEAITPTFAPPQTVQPLTQATIRQAAVTAGIPLVIQLQDEGWTEDEIDALRAARGDVMPETDADGVPVGVPTEGGIDGAEGGALAKASVMSGTGSVQATALNGAQIRAVQEVVLAVAADGLPAETVKQLIMIGFPGVDPARIDAMLAPLAGFEGKPFIPPRSSANSTEPDFADA